MSKQADFVAVTWNIFHGTPPAELKPLLRRMRGVHRVSLFLMQEVSNPEVRNMLRAEGLRVIFHPRQYVIAYDPAVWSQITASGVRLGNTSYFRRGGDGKQYSEAVLAILADQQGRTLTAGSYHTPAHVQVKPAKVPQGRYKALRESMVTLGKLAAAAHTRAVLFGGDDNVDERRQPHRWRFMRRKATGLLQTQAPGPTHGKSRRIDDFRSVGLIPCHGFVMDGGGDHKAHVRGWRWAPCPR